MSHNRSEGTEVGNKIVGTGMEHNGEGTNMNRRDGGVKTEK